MANSLPWLPPEMAVTICHHPCKKYPLSCDCQTACGKSKAVKQDISGQQQAIGKIDNGDDELGQDAGNGQDEDKNKAISFNG